MDADLRSIHDARRCVTAARAAAETFRSFDQEAADRIAGAVAVAGSRESERLARLAVEDSGFGTVPGKTAKNRFATAGLWERIRDWKTCGLIRTDEARRIREYAEPAGVIAAIIPITNPTSTVLYTAIIALKSRNAVVVSPHPRGVRCVREAVAVARAAAESAGAPPGVIQCLETVTIEGTGALLRHPDVDLIVATGGAGLVTAAYSSGKPAFGVGPGNVPCFVDRSADPAAAAGAIVESQTFDNGTICCSEQALICEAPVRDRLLPELRARRAHICTPEEARRLGGVVSRGGAMNPDITGRFPRDLAAMAGFEVPADTTVLIASVDGVGPDHPLSMEKLAPILALYVVRDRAEAAERCREILEYGGLGHTVAIHATDEAAILEISARCPASRVIVNAPSSQGAVGFATELVPAMTLGCGTWGGNISSDNLGPLHLVNVKRVAWVRSDWPAADPLPGSPAAAATAGDPDRVVREILASRQAGHPLGRTWRGTGRRDHRGGSA